MIGFVRFRLIDHARYYILATLEINRAGCGRTIGAADLVGGAVGIAIAGEDYVAGFAVSEVVDVIGVLSCAAVLVADRVAQAGGDIVGGKVGGFLELEGHRKV